MALNAPDTPVAYQMKYSEAIKRSMTPDDIGQMVSDKNSLKHLVLSCHGFGDPAKVRNAG